MAFLFLGHVKLFPSQIYYGGGVQGAGAKHMTKAHQYQPAILLTGGVFPHPKNPSQEDK